MKKTILAILPLLILSLSGPLFAAEPESEQNQVVAAMMVDINQASAEELAAGLSGVGEARAKAIVEHRNQNGAFDSIQSLADVTGIGEAILAANASRIEL